MQDENHASNSEPDLRVYFAAERTTLAWVRTGLAMMGFGFVVAERGRNAVDVVGDGNLGDIKNRLIGQSTGPTQHGRDQREQNREHKSFGAMGNHLVHSL